MSWCAKQLRWALKERATADSRKRWIDWDDEARYLAGLLITGEYDG